MYKFLFLLINYVFYRDIKGSNNDISMLLSRKNHLMSEYDLQFFNF